MKNTNKKPGNTLLFTFTFLGVFPLILIFLTYFVNPECSIFHYIFINTKNIPSVTSAFNPLMTKAMDLYCKSAPLLALLVFSLTFKKTKTLKIFNRGNTVRSCLFSPFVYAICMYLLMFRNFELTMAGRPLKMMSENNTGLLFSYLMIYIVIFFMTYAVCYVPVISLKLYKER
ncbi:colicin immunity protein Cui [Erwinia sp. P6884]|uniref:colicin immunity protein Cui n=1 Tax=Erwinia sp. P6884 TaxID=3141450 RepID=UPI0031996C7D